jgi:hypothetical protein
MSSSDGIIGSSKKSLSFVVFSDYIILWWRHEIYDIMSFGQIQPSSPQKNVSVRLWRDQLFWDQTLLREISTRESTSNWLGQVYMYDSQFERASWSDCYTACRNLKQQMIQNSFDCMISQAIRCIRAGGHAFTDKYRRLFLTSANVLTIKYNGRPIL